VSHRTLIGYACLILGFALVIALGTGYMEPLGMTTAPTSAAGLLRAMAPSIALAVALFLLGLWLVNGPRRK
jgi:hypothetical protein